MPATDSRRLSGGATSRCTNVKTLWLSRSPTHAESTGARGRVERSRAMLVSYESATIDPHLELVAVADDMWRISDGRIPENDARRILGLAERHDGCVEVMWMHSSPSEQEFSCIAEALAAASERMHRLDVV
jgi:hypothetical protein